MPSTATVAPVPRRVEDLLLSAADISVVDRTSLSLWHFQQLTKQYFPSVGEPSATVDKAGDAEEKENASAATFESPVAPPLAPAAVAMELEEGMTMAAIAYKKDDVDPHAADVSDFLGTNDAGHSDREARDDADSNSGAHKAESEEAHVATPSVKPDENTDGGARLTMESSVAVVYKRYRCVLCLDASPSSRSIDPMTGRLYLDLLYESIELFVRALLRPMTVGDRLFAPEFHVSVVVQGALLESLCVLVQGFVLVPSNMQHLLQLVRERIHLIEDDWAVRVQNDELGEEERIRRHQAGLSSILQNAVFALNSLPSDAAPLLVLATDGVVDLSNAYAYDNIMMQLGRHDVQCHFLRIGYGSDHNASFGFVPDVDLLQFLADSSGGSVIDYVGLNAACVEEQHRDQVSCMTSLQRTMLVRGSSLSAISAPIFTLDEHWCASFDGSNYLPLRPYRLWRQQVHEYRIHANVDRIVEARIREGFMINKIHIKNIQKAVDGKAEKGLSSSSSSVHASSSTGKRPHESQPYMATKILLVFLMKWKQNVWLEYVVSSTIDHSTGKAIHGIRSLSNANGGPGYTSGATKKDLFANEWYVKVNVLAYADFLRAVEDSLQSGTHNVDPMTGKTAMAAIVPGGATSLHAFICDIQDVDRVLLHLMTASASAASAVEASSQLSFGNSSNTVVNTNQSQITHPVFGIIGELSPVLWHRWFHVERFEVLCVVKDDSCAEVFYRPPNAPILTRHAASYHGVSVRSRSRKIGLFDSTGPQMMFGVDRSIEQIRGAVMRWSSQRLSKDLYLKFLVGYGTGNETRRGRPMNTTTSNPGVGGVGSGANRRRQRSSLNSMMIASQLAQMDSKREEPERGALCFVRLEVKNRTLAAVHVAFFSCSASVRKDTLADLRNSIVAGIHESSSGQTGATVAGQTNISLISPSTKSAIVCHRKLSRLLVTHETLLLDELPGNTHHRHQPDASDPDAPISSCCGGSELQLRAVFGAYMWHSSWYWHLRSAESLVEVMRRIHEERIHSGFWVLDWRLEEDGDTYRVASIIFGREILLKDDQGRVTTALVQYAMRRVSDTTMTTSIWMEPQYGFVQAGKADNQVDKGDISQWGGTYAVGHDTPIDDAISNGQSSTPTKVSYGSGLMRNNGLPAQTCVGEERIFLHIRALLFRKDLHLLSSFHTFQTLMMTRERIDLPMSRLYRSGDRLVGAVSDIDLGSSTAGAIPAFSTARLLEASKRSTEHFLMYLESNHSSNHFGPSAISSATPSLSSANAHLYSMLERTLLGLSDFEVAWTDHDGHQVSGDSYMEGQILNGLLLAEDTANLHLPVWIRRSVANGEVDIGVNDRKTGLSSGRCFAKVTNNDTIILAFLPDISKVELKSKKPMRAQQSGSMRDGVGGLPPIPSEKKQSWGTRMKREVPHSTKDIGGSASMLRMSVSADDIVLYQERRLSFREGYKSWRMGHYQGSKDDKSNQDHLVPNSRAGLSTSEDFRFCESISQSAEHGCDRHLLVQRLDGSIGSGFFQVAFYECSLSQVATAATNAHGSKTMSRWASPVQHLFSSAPIGDQFAESSRRKPPLSGGVRTPPAPSSVNAMTAGGTALASAIRFQKQVKRAHEHNFSRGVYMALRDNTHVQQSDLMQALSSCIDVPVDLDITLLYRVLQLDMANPIRSSLHGLRPPVIDIFTGRSKEALKQRLDQSLQKILKNTFGVIAGTKYFFFEGSEEVFADEGDESAEGTHLQDDVDGDQEEQILLDDDDIDSNVLEDGSQILEEDSEHGSTTSAPPQLPSSTSPRRASSEAIETEQSSEFDATGMHMPSSNSVLTDDDDDGAHEEDAEFNIGVAEATSGFSAPFFFRYEYREIGEQRQRVASSAAALPSVESVKSTRPLHRSASTKSFLDLRELVSTPTNSLGRSLGPSETRGIGASDENGSNRYDVADWIAKGPSCRIALRLVTLTLPNEQLLERSRRHVLPFDVSGKTTLASAAELYASLPHFQRKVLKKLRRSIKEWSSVEILRILRSVDRVTPAIGRLTHQLFKDLPSDCVTTIKYPLHFVISRQDNVDPLELFKKELVSGNSVKTCQCDDLYFVVQQLGHTAYSTLSVMQEVEENAVHEVSDQDTIPYWAYFVVDPDCVRLHLHHPDRFGQPGDFDRLGVLTQLHLAVNAMCKRVNQFLLLLQLHETRSCSELLLPAGLINSDSPPSPTLRRETSGSMDWEKAMESRESFYWPGQFECDLQYHAFFRLQERLIPNVALNMLCTSALEQFQVHNRRHVFVYRDRGGHVFYMKMSVSTSATPPNRPVGSARSSFVALQDITGGDKTATGGPYSGILLEVFGVCAAGEEVTQELCRLLERKLDEATQLILMKLLARNAKFQLNASDMAFMCPPGVDPHYCVQYIVPQGVYTSGSAFSLFLSQSLDAATHIRLLTANTNPGQREPLRAQGYNEDTVFCSSIASASNKFQLVKEVAIDATQIHPVFHGIPMNTSSRRIPIEDEDGGSKDPTEISPVFFSHVGESRAKAQSDDHLQDEELLDQLMFAVNLNPELRLSQGFLSRVGKGLAVLRVDILRSHGVAKTGGGTPMRKLSLPGITSKHHDTDGNSDCIVVRYHTWIRGAVNAVELTYVLESYLKEAVFDCYIEEALRGCAEVCAPDNASDFTSTKQPTLPRGMSRLGDLLEGSSRMASTSVTKLALPKAVPAWDVSNVVTQIGQTFRCLPPQFRPKVFVSSSRSNLEFELMQGDREADPTYSHFKIVPGASDLETTTTLATIDRSDSSRGFGSLTHSDSIHSDLSDSDSISGRQSIGSISYSGSIDSLISSSTPSVLSIREFTATEMMLHSNSKPGGSSVQQALAAAAKRSFYYIVDVSTSGIVVYGYNMSSQLVDVLATQLSRILTWSFLRESMLRSLLMTKGGVTFSAPTISAVVQPFRLQHGGRHDSSIMPLASGKEISINCVDFRTSILPVLQQYNHLPKVIESTLLFKLENTSFTKLLREFNVGVVNETADGRLRSRSIAGGGDVSMKETRVGSSSQSQSRVGGDNNPMRIDSRTERASNISGSSSSGGHRKADSMSSSQRIRGGGSSASLAGPNAGSNGRISRPRIPNGSGNAANALIAARARARGGLPGKLGGPGVGSSRNTNAGDSVAPWDIPVTNSRIRPPSSGARLGDSSSVRSISSGRMSSTTASNPIRMAATNVAASSISGSSGGAASENNHLTSGSGGGRLNPRSSTQLNRAEQSSMGTSNSKDSDRDPPHRSKSSGCTAWKKELQQRWSPRIRFGVKPTATKSRPNLLLDDRSAREKLTNPVLHYGDAWKHQSDRVNAASLLATQCISLFRAIRSKDPSVQVLDAASNVVLRSMVDCGHLALHQRYRVTFVERWEVIKIDEEYEEDGSNDNSGRVQAFQASMDLVNLLSYKKEFVFSGRDRTVANLLMEHTVQAMCAREGKAVRELKMHTLKDVFHLRMRVVRQFYDQYALHLTSLGFQHLQVQSNQPPLLERSSSRQSTVDAVAADGQSFSEYFVLSSLASCGKRVQFDADSEDVLVLEMKCDHNGVQVIAVLISEHDLIQRHAGHQSHFFTTRHHAVQGDLVKNVVTSLRSTLNMRLLIHDFTIRFLQECLIRWSACVNEEDKDKMDSPASTTTSTAPLPESSTDASSSTTSRFNMVKGIRCFLETYPRPPSAASTTRVASPRALASAGEQVDSDSLGDYDCILATEVVDVPVRNLQSNCAESIHVKILLRYVACHKMRYEVTDLTQFGTPDTLVCHSPSGSFFNRKKTTTLRRGNKSVIPMGRNQPGYSLLITTQELWQGKKRPKNSVLLTLLRAAPAASANVGVALLPVERALAEAELFVKEMFRAAATNYERDLLWSRLLYSDTGGLGADVAQTLGLPVEHFRVEVGTQQLEECLRLSECTPLEKIDAGLSDLLSTDDVVWQEFALRLRHVFAGQMREYQFEGETACHFLLLCPTALDLMIHVTFPSGVTTASLNMDENRVRITICRREESPNQSFTYAQRRVISEFVNTIVHWLWRCLFYD